MLNWPFKLLRDFWFLHCALLDICLLLVITTQRVLFVVDGVYCTTENSFCLKKKEKKKTNISRDPHWFDLSSSPIFPLDCIISFCPSLPFERKSATLWSPLMAHSLCCFCCIIIIRSRFFRLGSSLFPRSRVRHWGLGSVEADSRFSLK